MSIYIDMVKLMMEVPHLGNETTPRRILEIGHREPTVKRALKAGLIRESFDDIRCTYSGEVFKKTILALRSHMSPCPKCAKCECRGKR